MMEPCDCTWTLNYCVCDVVQLLSYGYSDGICGLRG